MILPSTLLKPESVNRPYFLVIIPTVLTQWLASGARRCIHQQNLAHVRLTAHAQSPLS